jgi:hypothetical protein
MSGAWEVMRKAAVIASFVGAVLSATAQTPRQVWRLDLSSLPTYKDAALTEDSSRGFSFDFVDDNTILVGATFVSGPHWRPDNSIEPVLSNRAIFAIDARNGALRNSQRWSGWRGLPAVDSGRAFYPIGTGESLTSVGDQLIRLSSTLEVLARRELPLNRIDLNGHPQQDHWWILSDPRTRKALLVRSPFPGHGPVSQEVHWISVNTLEDESSISLPASSAGGVGALVGDSVVLSGGTPSKESVTIQKGNGSPRPLCAKCTGLVEGTFGGELIFLEARPAYLVVDAEGTVHYRGGRIGGRADTIGSVSGAITKNRVAFEFGHLGRGLEETVVVLDIDAKKEILRFKENQAAEITVGKLIEEKFVSPQLALSPDGSKLAILTGTSISLFDVP